MMINPTYDASVTGLTNASQVEAAFVTAAQVLQKLYTNNITVNITVYWGATGPFSGGIGLGESQTDLIGNPTYAQLTNALRASRTTVADSNSVASLPAGDPIGTNVWWIPRAQIKALNLPGFSVSPNDATHDGDVGFAATVNYAFDATNRAVVGEYDFIGVAEHEITEVLGRSFILNYGITGFQPFDLFRFTNSGARSFNVFDTNVYFSVNNGITALKDYYNDVNTGDVQDWLGGSPADACNAFLSAGQKAFLSAADLTAVDILGYNLSFQPPHLAGKRLSTGAFQLSFTNVAGLDFSVLTSTNVVAALTNWSSLGTPTENPAGQYQSVHRFGRQQVAVLSRAAELILERG